MERANRMVQEEIKEDEGEFRYFFLNFLILLNFGHIIYF